MTQPIIAQERNGHLHVQLEGDVNATSVELAVNIAQRVYSGKGNIFFHTEKVQTVSDDSSRAFFSSLETAILPTTKMYMIGQKGFDLGEGRVRVILRPEKKARCGGCREKAQPQKEILH